MMKAIVISCVLLRPLLSVPAALPQKSEDKLRYLRLGQKEPSIECEFKFQRNDAGWSIQSTTQRRPISLTVSSQYDKDNRLTTADAVLAKGDEKKATLVQIVDGKAKVKREGQEVQEFDVPPGVIVTSAPDWTDTFLLCQRYDRAKGGKQEFAALWIHVEQPAQRLTFTIEKTGADSIEHEGKKVELDRYAIRIRGNSSYVAWADAKGRMIKLAGLPFKEGQSVELVLDGYEKSAAKLRPMNQ
jgi:hypothetical protein